ncbi:hypothetical protein LX32DRAFT_657436 [Colletotrichum zoysiae]|uniref:Uncharacterized protein n=1 Tax=Colletotrichum zoysiae TaxID=1216348 RepID=A0AAD9H5F5_9PEZI|nr:hypothetical protein LX32DRAFT_657436 [Colletotrichum zoysiae]
MSAIGSFHGDSSSVMPFFLKDAIALELSSMLDDFYPQLRYFPKFIRSQVEEQVMEHVAREFAEEIRLYNLQGNVLFYVHRLFKDASTGLVNLQPLEAPPLSPEDMQAIESAVCPYIENVAYDCVLAGVEIGIASLVDDVYDYFLRPDFDSRWELACCFLDCLVNEAGDRAREAISAKQSNDFVGLRHYVRHHLPALLQGLETELLDGIYDRLDWQRDEVDKPSVLRLIADELIDYHAAFERVADTIYIPRRRRAAIRATLQSDVPVDIHTGPEPRLPVPQVPSDAPKLCGTSFPDADEEIEFALAHPPNPGPSVKISFATIPLSLLKEIQDAIDGVLTEALSDPDHDDLDLDSMIETIYAGLQAAVPGVESFPGSTRTYIMDAYNERVESMLAEYQSLDRDEAFEDSISDLDDEDGSDADYDAMDLDDEDKDENDTPPPRPTKRRKVGNSSTSALSGCQTKRRSSRLARKRPINEEEEAVSDAESESPFASSQRLDHFGSKPSLRIWMAVLDGCVTTKNGRHSRQRCIEYLGNGRSFHDTFQRLESESLCQGLIDAGRICLSDLKELCKPASSVQTKGSGHYMALITDEDRDSWYAKYIGQAVMVSRRITEHHNYARIAASDGKVKKPATCGCLIYRAWKAKGTRRHASWLELSNVTKLDSETEIEFETWLCLLEMFFSLAFQTLQANYLDTWLPSEIPRQRHVGLNVALPLGGYGRLSLSAVLKSVHDPELLQIIPNQPVELRCGKCFTVRVFKYPRMSNGRTPRIILSSLMTLNGFPFKWQTVRADRIHRCWNVRTLRLHPNPWR